MEKIERQHGCSSCKSQQDSAIENRRSLVALGKCTKGSLVQGGTLDLSVTVSSGTPPFNIIWYKIAPGSTTKTIIFTDPNKPVGTYTHSYIIPINEIPGDWTYGADTSDSLSTTFGGPKTCGSSCIVTIIAIPVLTTISVNIANASIVVGSTTMATAACADQFGLSFSCPVLNWASSDTSVATVNSVRVITGISVGTATITATDPVTGKYGFAVITVTEVPPVLTTIIITPATVTINVGQTIQLTAICKDQYGATMSCLVTWAYNNPNITVDTLGLVTGSATGTGQINAIYGSVQGSATITVIEAPPVLTTITISPSSVTIGINGTSQLKAVCNITCPVLTWTSGDNTVAMVSSTGLVTGISSGTSTITAIDPVTGKYGFAVITVSATAPPVTQAGFGGVEMILIAGLVIGAIYEATKKK
jgi:uncharacterized protein YjdB